MLPAKRKAGQDDDREDEGDSDMDMAVRGNGSGGEVAGQSSCEDGEIEEDEGGEGGDDEEGELTAEGERALIDAAVSADVKAGGKDVAQKDARYFMMENVVCENCGTKGHLSYDCTEQRAEKRCFLCGQQGHGSKDCPKEVCYICGDRGHRSKECPKRKGGKVARMRERRGIRPPRAPKLSCYVCGGEGHLDCGLMKLKAGVLSCYNCGMEGHSGAGCHMTSVDRVVPIVLELERERREGKEGKVKRRGNKGGREEDGNGGKGRDEAKEYREKILDLARKRRYGR